MKLLCILLLAATVLYSSTALSGQQIMNPNYTVYPGPEIIRHDFSELDQVFRRHYGKYIPYRTPDGGTVLLVANEAISDEQLLRAYNILDFFLTDVPGSRYGADKRQVANNMAKTGAVLVMPDGSDGDTRTPEYALAGQPLYQREFPVEGSAAYINNDFDERDAGFEEIFHLVHDFGIGSSTTTGPLKSSFQAEITKAMENGLRNGLWGRGEKTAQWLEELRAEGSLEQEYIVSALDSYYGYWGAWVETDGGMYGVYAAKTREDVERLDPAGYALLRAFLPPVVTYMARIDPAFRGSFEMRFDPDIPYTHKSRYLVNARLLGNNPSGISGNDNDNILMGNRAPNNIDGRRGRNVVQFDGATDDYTFEKQGGVLIVTDKRHPENQHRLKNIAVLRFTDEDMEVSSL